MAGGKGVGLQTPSPTHSGANRGTSLIAAGWKVLYETKGGSWNVPSRPRIDRHPLGQKKLWEAPSNLVSI